MATIKTFRELEVWQLAMHVVIDCYSLTRGYPLEERYALQRETRRSAVSIPSNVAEGHNRHAPAAYLNHVNISLGSQGELETQVEIAIRLGYLSNEQASSFLVKVARVGQMLHGLQRSLESKRTRAWLFVAFGALCMSLWLA